MLDSIGGTERLCCLPVVRRQRQICDKKFGLCVLHFVLCLTTAVLNLHNDLFETHEHKDEVSQRDSVGNADSSHTRLFVLCMHKFMPFELLGSK